MSKQSPTPVTILGRDPATFSFLSYKSLQAIYGGPLLQHDKAAPDMNCMWVETNSDILPNVLKHGGYATIAMDTLAGGCIAEQLNTYLDLLNLTETETPFHVIGGLAMTLTFCLMTRPGVDLSNVKRVFAHPKSFGACKNIITELGVMPVEVSSNGEAATVVRQSWRYDAALGPEIAATTNNLVIHRRGCEDRKAVTTFFLLGPTSHAVSIGPKNRAIIGLRLRNQPGALADVFSLMRTWNCMYNYQRYRIDGEYDFGFEYVMRDDEVPAFKEALARLRQLSVVKKSFAFGPFEVR